MFRWFKILSLLALSGCLSPSYLDSKDGPSKDGTSNPFGEVNFHVYDAYTSSPPNCVAILPFTHADTLNSTDAELVRKTLYAHLAPQGKKDIELPRIDFILKNLPKTEQKNYHLIGQRLGCEALMTGHVSEYTSQYVGLYSKVSAGADLKIIRAKDGEPLWQGKHIAASHGGSIPLSPIGLAAGLLDAALNVEEEQSFRIVDDLARRLVLTIPDNSIAIFEQPLSSLEMENLKKTPKQQSIDDFLNSVSHEPQHQQKAALIKAINHNVFHGNDLKRVYDTLIKTAPHDAQANGLYAHYLVQAGDYFQAENYVDASLAIDGQNDALYFLKGRIQIKLNDLSGADTSILLAIALDPTNTKYLNGLGFLNSLRGRHGRALAAYQMAVDLDPSNGYALYNMGVTFYNTDDLQSAWDYISLASDAYLKAKDYGQVVKALADLKELKALNVVTNDKIEQLEQALLNIQRNG